MKYCKDCIHSHPKQGSNLDYCGKHRQFVTKFTTITTLKRGKLVECKDYKE